LKALDQQRARYGEADPNTAQAARDLGVFLIRQGDQAAGRTALEAAVRMDEAVFGPAAPQTLSDLAKLAGLLEPAAAEPRWKRAAGSSDAGAVRALGKLGEFRQQDGDHAAAAKLYRQAVQKEEAASGAASVRLASRLNTLALALQGEEAIVLLERALRITTARLGMQRLETASIQMNLANRLLDARKASRGARVAHQAAVTFEELLGPAHERTITSLMLESRCLDAVGDRGIERREALKILPRRLGGGNLERADHFGVRSGAFRLASLLPGSNQQVPDGGIGHDAFGES